MNIYFIPGTFHSLFKFVRFTSYCFFLPSTVKLEREAEEERIRKHKAAAEKAFQEGIAKAKLVMRRTPIGTDRNHNR